ncbi:pyridoxamine 5'-phosphate oxidase family protein [Paroceanicella profunda]|uniref:Pyridoxamine 5'-phosphate oxidase family protein n=1 Tax=Paroceanicella profunda TaxID=2579971 RepID=A0A5B8FZ59_9RHOB|nr:pyridoxamine 5'-phosphate oxidase family protein [Paroceanicella profunda]QDL92710.1 pyridoxamine 5'-phosphate oxidase family protein [Paroceanicella profunda]
MARQYPSLTPALREFIARQHVFFTASAAPGSRVNVSPRETGALRLPDETTALYLDRTGSGNETAAHMRADGRLTLMFCAFDGPPQILRLYGRGRSVGWETAEFRALLEAHYGGAAPLGARQIMRLEIELVQTSCGYGVPLFSYEGERAAIENWHQAKGEEGIRAYWEEKNLTSMDGLPTGLSLAAE